MGKSHECPYGATNYLSPGASDLAQFFTPPHLADLLVRLLPWQVRNGTMYEPAAGDGALIEAYLRRFGACYENKVYATDIDPKNVDILRHKFPKAHIECTDPLLHYPSDWPSKHLVSLTNPPWKRLMKEEKDYAKDLRAEYSISGSSLSSFFIAHTLQRSIYFGMFHDEGVYTIAALSPLRAELYPRLRHVLRFKNRPYCLFRDVSNNMVFSLSVGGFPKDPEFSMMCNIRCIGEVFDESYPLDTFKY